MEEDVGATLRQAVEEPVPPQNLAAAIRKRVASPSGATLDISAREPMRDPVRFD